MRPRKAKEAGKQTPNTRKKNTSPHKDRTSDKEEPKVMGKPESQEDQIARQQNKEASEEGGEATSKTADSNLGPRDYKVLSPGLQRTANRIEWRRRLGQNPAFLGAVERSLAKKRKELDTCNQELEENPSDKEIKEKATQLQHRIWLFEDTINWVKEGTYH